MSYNHGPFSDMSRQQFDVQTLSDIAVWDKNAFGDDHYNPGHVPALNTIVYIDPDTVIIETQGCLGTGDDGEGWEVTWYAMAPNQFQYD